MSTRRSTRLESKPATVFKGLDRSEADTFADDDSEFADENPSDIDHEGQVRKKRKKTGTSSRNAGRNAKHVKGRRGRLRALPYVQYLTSVDTHQFICFLGPSAAKCHWIFCTRSVLNGTPRENRRQITAHNQIFGHLRPYDILRLSRTTKALRGILMQRSATSVWKDARSNIEGLPDCPG